MDMSHCGASLNVDLVQSIVNVIAELDECDRETLLIKALPVFWCLHCAKYRNECRCCTK